MGASIEAQQARSSLEIPTYPFIVLTKGSVTTLLIRFPAKELDKADNGAQIPEFLPPTTEFLVVFLAPHFCLA